MRFSLVRKGRFALVDFRRTLSTLISLDEVHVRDKFKALGSGDVTVTKLRGNQQGIAVITLMNPERKNALTGYMMVKLAEAVDELEQWQDGKALVLRGSEGYFCSGGDLSVVKAINTPEEGNIMCAFMQRTLSRLGRLPLISVAAVEGRALGGGAEVSAEIPYMQDIQRQSQGWSAMVHLPLPHLQSTRSLIAQIPLPSLTWTQTVYLCERVASLQVKSLDLSFLEGAHQTDQLTPMYLGHSISID